MIPTVMFWGLVVGVNVSHRSHLLPLALLGALASIAWGALVAAIPGGSFLDGTALAAPNFAVGAGLGFVLGGVLRAAMHLVRGT